ncbi:phage portal protein, partial [Methylosinus sp. R-45379]|uniref:phage portal protein n=1 Tax=Methylosinus sp. R-45379 TaxID=980563 RepID=UPI0007C98322
LGGVIENGKTNLGPEGRDAMLASFNEGHRGPDQAFKWQYLDGGMTAKPFTVEPDKGQFIETQQHMVETICRWFGVPPHKIAHLLRATNNNIEHQGIEFVTDGIMPWVCRYEQEANYKLVNARNPQGYYTNIDVRSLQRGDLKARTEHYTAMLDRGVFSINDVLYLEGMNNIGALGDKRLVNGAYTTLEAVGTPEAPLPGNAPAPAEDPEETDEPPAANPGADVDKENEQAQP